MNKLFKIKASRLIVLRFLRFKCYEASLRNYPPQSAVRVLGVLILIWIGCRMA